MFATIDLLRLVFVLLTCSAFICHGQANKSEIKDIKTPFWVKSSISKLSNYLTKDDTSDYQKAWHIYSWVVHNIRYDVNESKKSKIKYQKPQITLRKGKGICYQYSELYKLLCLNAGLSCVEIPGYSRGYEYFENEMFYESDHSWNAVKLDSTWHLVDPTWGSGFLVQKKRPIRAILFKWFRIPFILDEMKFIHLPNETFWDVDPATLLIDHLPVDPIWQLVEYPIGLQTFEDKSWNQYTEVMDTVYCQYYDSSFLSKTLQKYEFLSPNQFLEQTALASNLFNNKNYVLLGQNEFVKANSILRSNTNSLNDLTMANNHLVLAIKFFKKHQSSVNTVTSMSIKKFQKDYNDNIAFRVKGLSRFTRREKRISDKSMTKIESLKMKWHNEVARNISRQNNRKPNEIGDIHKKRDRPELVKANLERLIDESNTIRTYVDSLRRYVPIFDSLINSNKNLQTEVLVATLELNNQVLHVSNSIISNLNLSYLKTEITITESKMLKVDSLIKKERYQRLMISKFYRHSQSLHSSIVSKVRYCQKLIEQNCLFSSNPCDNRLYDEGNQIIDVVDDLRTSISEGIHQTTPNDINYLSSIQVEINKVSSKVELLGLLSDYYRIRRAGGISFKKNRSDYYTTLMLKKLSKNQSQVRRAILQIERNANK